jgi:hypothetical protein
MSNCFDIGLCAGYRGSFTWTLKNLLMLWHLILRVSSESLQRSSVLFFGGGGCKMKGNWKSYGLMDALTWVEILVPRMLGKHWTYGPSLINCKIIIWEFVLLLASQFLVLFVFAVGRITAIIFRDTLCRSLSKHRLTLQERRFLLLTEAQL